MKLRLMTMIALGLASMTTAQTRLASYDFTPIADTSGSLSALGPSLSLNNSGTVSFWGLTRSGVAQILTSDGRRLTTVIETEIGSSGPGFTDLSPWTSINASGTVAFNANTQTTGGIFTGSGGPITTIASGLKMPVSFIGDPFFAFDPGPSINNAGVVAFQASRLFVGHGFYGLFTGNGGTIDMLYIILNRNPTPVFGRPAINERGTLAFFQVVFPPVHGAIQTGDGGPTTTIADTLSGFSSLDLHPSINNAGIVAFGAILTTGVGGIFLGSGGPVITVADTTGPFADFSGSSPIINNQASVVFFARLDSGELGIFTGPDPVADKVIAVGDPLLGSAVAEFFLDNSRLGFNDRGQVAFLARLQNGVDVVVRADPRHR